MAKFFEAVRRHAADPLARADLTTPQSAQTAPGDLRSLIFSDRLVHVALPSENLVPPALARLEGIHRITESFAGVAIVSGSARLAIAGCAAGDGCSAVAAAIALDLTQRLGVRTLLVDGNIYRPGILKMFGIRRTSVLELESTTVVELESERKLLVRSSNWARLEVATLNPPSEKSEPADAFEELSERVSAFPAAVMDLGAVRLGPLALPLVRSNDPVLLVVRAGRTRRSELSATMNIFSNIGRPIKGVVLNAPDSAVPSWIRRLFWKEA